MSTGHDRQSSASIPHASSRPASREAASGVRQARGSTADASASSVRKVGLKDVARQAGVSISSVSMALADHPDMNQETKLRIRQISRQMGYRKSRKATSALGRQVIRFGFVLLGSHLEDEVHLGVFNALTAQAHRADVRLEVRAIADLTTPQAVIDDVFTFATHLDGLVLSGYVDGPLLAELGNAGIAHVSLGHTMVDMARVPDCSCQVVTCDEMDMAMLATRSLIKAGHQRIAFICERIPRGLWNERWLRGYYATLSEQGIKLDPDLVQITGRTFTGAKPAIDRLMLLRDRPTAYIAPDVRMGASVIKSLAEQGIKLQPPDMVISGHNRLVREHRLQDWPWIGFDLETIAAVAIRQLRHLYHEPMPCSSEVYIPYLVRNLPGAADSEQTH